MELHDPKYEQQHGESEKAYKAFCLYRDMDPLVRSLDKAYNELLRAKSGERVSKGRQESDRPPGYFQRWCRENRWVERTAAYDAYREKLARQDAEKLYVKQLRDFRQRQQRLSSVVTETAIKALSISNRRLDDLVKLQDLATEIPSDLLPQYLRAAAAIAESASNSEAQALAVDAILKELMQNEKPDST